MTPGLTCHRCHAPLYPHLARAGKEGLRHITCPPRPCTECRRPIGAKAVSGLCRPCYDRALRSGRVTSPAHPATPACIRCGARGAAICGDCIDVAADLHELGRWVA